MHRKVFRGFLLVLVSFVASVYARWTWQTSERAAQIVLGLKDRPFVYRAFVPWMARILTKLGLAAETALGVVIVISAIGLYYGLEFLAKSIRR